MLHKFDDMPENLFIAIIESIFFNAFGSFLFSRTLKKEFLANRQNTKSSKEFRDFLHTLPEGVTIVDDETSEFKFVNFKFRQTLNIKNFKQSNENSIIFDRLHEKIDTEFEKMARKFSISNSSSNQIEDESNMENVLNCFKVTQCQESEKIKRNLEHFDGEESEDEMFERKSLMPKSHEMTLRQFLSNERRTSRYYNINSRSAKVQLSCNINGVENDEEIIKREFIVKTKKVCISDDLSEKQALFMHMFIDTTQIIQLEEAKAQNRYQKQMLANVSHEFRTPLNAMMISLALLKDIVKGPPIKFVKIANSSCNILAALVEDILDHAKIESGVFEIQETEFKFDELVEEVNDIFELQAKSKKIKFII
jgi:K+-sensing histidine kinase KdpD